MTDVAPPLELDGPAAAPAPDDPSVDLFGAASPAYTVLARKYRPRRFEDLIGQEGMVRTLRNAFATGRIAHAFMLTGVRGVGKTTTARLLARALNFESDTVDRPSLEALAGEGRHCPAILEGRHLDVLELDAASRTKVDEMRELLDGVRYAPANARYKIYIIDEVHMLSTHSFNALLKTLEEPPPHAKFIFATTEIRKVPVTILSRCQRFDLRRVEPEVIAANLARIAQAEGFQVETDALALIARAAEGSVRDAQSLLDQALVQVEAGQPVGEAIVRDMLGMVDRALTIGLFEEVVRGDAAAAITTFRELYAHGADPPTVVMDLLEHCHAASVAKMLGPEALVLPKDQAARLTALGAEMGTGALSRIWQMLLKAHEEARQAPDPAAAVDMTLIRLAYAADLPGPEEAIRALRAGETTPGESGGAAASGGAPASRMTGGGGGRAMLAGAPAPAPMPQGAPRDLPRTFEDVMALVEARRDVALKLDLERHARPISVRPGAIVFEPTADAPVDLAHRLSARLKAWTGQPWLVAAEGGGGAETFHEREGRAAREDRAAALAEPYIQALMTVFPGAELIAVRRLGIPEPAAEIDERAPPTEED
ncbi:MAG: DNA polymerase III subunit gamma/tau [Caulobacteraceae bacterium]